MLRGASAEAQKSCMRVQSRRLPTPGLNLKNLNLGFYSFDRSGNLKPVWLCHWLSPSHVVMWCVLIDAGKHFKGRHNVPSPQTVCFLFRTWLFAARPQILGWLHLQDCATPPGLNQDLMWEQKKSPQKACLCHLPKPNKKRKRLGVGPIRRRQLPDQVSAFRSPPFYCLHLRGDSERERGREESDDLPFTRFYSHH